MPLTSNGYLYEVRHGHPLADTRGRVLVHRRVWFDAHGACHPSSIIHHKNGDKQDNRLENLEEHCRSSHAIAHYDDGLKKLNGEKELVQLVCASCGAVFIRRASVRRQNRKLTRAKLHLPACSGSCRATIRNWYRYGKLEEHIDRRMIEELK